MFNRFLLVLVAVISSVTAHVTVTPATMVSGAKYQTLTFRIGHACNVNTSVTSLSIQLPPQEQVTAFKSSFIYGWKQNITLGGNATWSATSNEFYMPNSNFLDLPVSFSLGNFSADTNMTFYIAQICADGNVDNWTPALLVTAKPQTAQLASLSSDSVASDARSISIAAIVLSCVAILFTSIVAFLHTQNRAGSKENSGQTSSFMTSKI